MQVVNKPEHIAELEKPACLLADAWLKPQYENPEYSVILTVYNKACEFFGGGLCVYMGA